MNSNQDHVLYTKVYKRSNYFDAVSRCNYCSEVHRGNAQTERIAVKIAEGKFGDHCGEEERIVEPTISEEKPVKKVSMQGRKEYSENLSKHIGKSKCYICGGRIENDECIDCGLEIGNFQGRF